jgi:hypothetical protein
VSAISAADEARLRDKLANLQLQALRVQLGAALESLDAGHDEAQRIERVTRAIHRITLVPRAAA